MKITDEMVEAAAVVFIDNRTTECTAAARVILAAVAPLILEEAAKEIADQKDKAASLLRALSYEREINAANVAHIEAQAKEIAELKAALAEYQSGRNYLGRALVVKNGQASEDCSGYYQGGKP